MISPPDVLTVCTKGERTCGDEGKRMAGNYDLNYTE
jgi:hypothetical protein